MPDAPDMPGDVDNPLEPGPALSAGDRPAPGPELLTFLESGRNALADAQRTYGRPLGPDDYWWLSVCLAAAVLAELNDMGPVAARVAGLADTIGRTGISADRAGEMADELALLESPGLLWPRFVRDENGVWQTTGAELHPSFDAEAAYWLSLCHVATALLVAQGLERQPQLGELAELAADLVTGGLKPAQPGQPGQPEAILAIFGGIAASR